jgi:hypothetical protein
MLLILRRMRLTVGTIAVRTEGHLLRTIAVDVNVLPFALPDNLNFIVDLNAYGGVNSGSRRDSLPEMNAAIGTTIAASSHDARGTRRKTKPTFAVEYPKAVFP